MRKRQTRCFFNSLSFRLSGSPHSGSEGQGSAAGGRRRKGFRCDERGQCRLGLRGRRRNRYRVSSILTTEMIRTSLFGFILQVGETGFLLGLLFLIGQVEMPDVPGVEQQQQYKVGNEDGRCRPTHPIKFPVGEGP